jgi:hypothetical protein
MNDHDLRDLFAAPDELAPLDPATIIAGAHRRRRRDLLSGSVAGIAVLAVAAGSLLAVNHSNAGGPAKPPVAQLTSPTPSPSKQLTTPHLPSNATALTKAACLTAYADWLPGAPSAKSKVIGTVDGAEGRLMIVADSKYFGVCENSFGTEPSIREGARVKRPAKSDSSAFAVANNVLANTTPNRDFYWAAGLLPTGVAVVRYTFPDGKAVSAKVFGKYWALRYKSTGPAIQDWNKVPRIKVEQLAADGSVVKEFRLVYGEQSCAQISHGC